MRIARPGASTKYGPCCSTASRTPGSNAALPHLPLPADQRRFHCVLPCLCFRLQADRFIFSHELRNFMARPYFTSCGKCSLTLPAVSGQNQQERACCARQPIFVAGHGDFARNVRRSDDDIAPLNSLLYSPTAQLFTVWSSSTGLKTGPLSFS